MKMSPSTNTAASAVCHGIPSAITTVNAKYAFNPIPGASPNGRFAYSAITMEPTAAARIVVMASIWNTWPSEYPSMEIAADRIAGFTTMMYDIVRNVVSPATSSVFTSVSCFSNSKNDARRDRLLLVSDIHKPVAYQK
jgi:hypothetical protein